MPKTPQRKITFDTACVIVQQALACILDGNALAYPVINEDFDGNDCIEVNYNTEDGLSVNTFNKDDKYWIDEKGVLLIKQGSNTYTLQFLEVANPLKILKHI